MPSGVRLERRAAEGRQSMSQYTYTFDKLNSNEDGDKARFLNYELTLKCCGRVDPDNYHTVVLFAQIRLCRPVNCFIQSTIIPRRRAITGAA